MFNGAERSINLASSRHCFKDALTRIRQRYPTFYSSSCNLKGAGKTEDKVIQSAEYD